MKTVQVDYAGTIKVSQGQHPKELYEHQNQAIQALNKKSTSPFEGLLVLPTGGGKTLTAVHWLLREYIDKKKKVLWIAHRHELLDQALEAVQQSAYSPLLSNVTEFRFRIISGHQNHDRPVNIKPEDDIIIASKDSLNAGLDYLIKNWVRKNKDILLVIDEAHHAVAKTYRKLITAIKADFKKRKCLNGFSMLGLTATPFRTKQNEEGLLRQIFNDDIIFAEHLRNLIAKDILAEPVFESLETKEKHYSELTKTEIRLIENFDRLPKDIAEKIATSSTRNNQIVNHYVQNKDKYKSLLVFAIDIEHAIALNTLFKARKIKSDYVVAAIKDAKIGSATTAKDRKEKIEKFRKGELEVLVNVEILVEGTDLPEVQTVFLTRPTTSTILMTQMIGRVLRGKKAGGTEKAYIVSFIDEWEDKINWVNPEKLYVDEDAEFDEREIDRQKQITRLISIELIEEFARIMDDSIDTTGIEKLRFLRRIPVGIYRFAILQSSEEDKANSRNYDVLVFDDTEEAYDNFIHDLHLLFESVNLGEREKLSEAELEYLLRRAKLEYFTNHETLIGYRDEDVIDILRFYAQSGEKPVFLAFSKRKECDLSAVAKHIYDHDLGKKAEANYIDFLWNDEQSFWQILFGNNKLFFRKQLDTEINKLHGFYPNIPAPNPEIIPDNVPLETLSLGQIKERNTSEYKKIKEEVFRKHTDAEGIISCANSGFKSRYRIHFQIDHIKPMSKGGLTTIDNLQVLSIQEHRDKTDRDKFDN